MTVGFNMVGRVLWFNVEKGTGEILAKSQERLFFTSEDLLFKDRSKISDGAIVNFLFSGAQIFGRPRAKNIFLSNKKVSKASADQLRLPGLDG